MEKNVNQFDVRHMASVVKTRVVGLFALPNTSLADPLSSLSYGGIARKALTTPDLRALAFAIQQPPHAAPRGALVFVTLTSQPSRLLYVPFVLACIDFHAVNEVHINLPIKYKNQEPYHQGAVSLLENLWPSRIKVYRPKFDLGPASKVVPTLERLRHRQQSAATVCISIDDDIAYHHSLFGTLARRTLKYGGVWCSWGMRFQEWDGLRAAIPRTDWPRHTQSATHVDMIEGFSGVAYPVDARTVPMCDHVRRLAALCLDCRLSDDFMLSFALNRLKVPTRKVPSMKSGHIALPFDGWVGTLDFGEKAGLHVQNPFTWLANYSIESTGLHAHTWLANYSIESTRLHAHVNELKYRKCWERAAAAM